MTKIVGAQRRRFWLVMGSVAAVILSLAGCAPAPSFDVPIRWGEGRLQTTGSDAQPQRVETAVALFSGGEAWVQDFPQGVMREQGDGSMCLDVTAPERHTGEVAWSAKSDHRVELTFLESRVEIFDGGGRFGSQDWSVTRIVECGQPVVTWSLSLACGDPGFDLPGGAAWRPCED